jgi:hypothetical protein
VTGPLVPGREHVRQQLLDLLAGRISREEVADWASTWVRKPESSVEDPVVWEALKQLAGADLRESPLDYLHSESDFHEWLDRVEEAGQQ